jgi:hypothetical protein
MSICEQSADEFFLSLTGFDEIAIAKMFAADISELRERPFTFLRALAFVHQRRHGLVDRDAHEAAQQLTIAELGDYFTDAADADLGEELDSDEPVSEPGKGPPPSE